MLPNEPEILDYLARVDALYPDRAEDESVVERRRIYEAMCDAFKAPRPEGVTVSDDAVTEGERRIPIRLYRRAGAGTAATILWIHGGGFVVGSLDSHDSICADICAATGAPVVAVDYRLAPEHTGLDDHEDCWAAFRQLAGEGHGIVLAGDSAGANLAAGIALRARDEGSDAAVGQALVYPELGGDTTTGSYVEMANAPGLTTADIRDFRQTRAAPKDDARAWPLLVSDLAGLPPAFVTAARFDPLRDDGRAYAARLASAGVSVTFREEPQMVHAWLRARHLSPGARSAFDALCGALAALARGTDTPLT
jgi:acetyl esterase